MNDMKNKNILIGILVVLVLISGILIGISISDKNKVYEEDNTIKNNTNDNSNVINKDNEMTKEETNDKVNVKEEVPKNDKGNNSNINNESKDEITTIPVTETYSTKDVTVINNLNDTLKKVQDSPTSDKNFAKSAKGTFVSIVDFLFYGGTINGITFSELTESGKSKVLEIASRIDSVIESKIPGYKDAIASGTSKAFNKASNLIKAGASNINNFIKDNLDESDYNSLIDAKDELILYSKNAFSFVGNVGSGILNSAKDKLNNWYQNWKNK